MKNLYQQSSLLSQSDFYKLEKAFRKSWSLDTANPDIRAEWSETNPAYGQCTPTALVISDLYGGKLIYDKENYHIWNELPDDTEQDFSREQFRENVKLSIYKYLTMEDILESEHGKQSRMKERYQLLRENVKKNLDS